MAKARGLISKLRISLSDLCVRILHSRLDKNPVVRTSTAWEDRNLPETHIEYAALDAWATLQLYSVMQQIAVPGELPVDSSEGTEVALWHEDRSQVVAYGMLASRDKKKYNGVNITKTRTLVTVTEVVLDSALVTLHGKKPLSAFGAVPFSIVCPWNRLQSRPNDPLPPPLPAPSPRRALTSLGDDSITTVTNDIPGSTHADAGNHLPTEPLQEQGVDNPVSLQDAVHTPAGTFHEDNPSEAERDETSAAEGADILAEFRHLPEDDEFLARVLKDAWHLMDMPKVPVHHGLRHPYFRAFRDAMFIPDKEDRARIEEYAARNDTTFEKLLLYRPKWVLARCKRYIPRPRILLPLVTEVFKTYGPLKDASTNQPLFNRNAWKAVRGVLRTIHDGFVSDPPGIALYYQIGIDSKSGGLPIYRCCRGTNFTEGGIHRPILSSFPTTGVGPRHAVNRLKIFAYVHNRRVSNNDSQYVLATRLTS